LRCKRLAIFTTLLHDQRREESSAAIQFTFPPTVINSMYNFPQDPDHLALSEGEFLWAGGFIVIQSQTVAFQTCASTAQLYHSWDFKGTHTALVCLSLCTFETTHL
jgi:hypothetical protein